MRHVWSREDIKVGKRIVILGRIEATIRAFALSSNRRFSEYRGAAEDEKAKSFLQLWNDESANVLRDLANRYVVLAPSDPADPVIGPFKPRALATWLTAINAREG